LEVVGDVVEVGREVVGVRTGDRVWTMMQGLGGVRAERDGGYAEHVTVPASFLERRQINGRVVLVP
jgi:NADPH2:quinone reductase